MLTFDDYQNEIKDLCKSTAHMNGMTDGEYEQEMFFRIMKDKFYEPSPAHRLISNTRRRYILLNPVDYQNYTPDCIYSKSSLYLLIDFDEREERVISKWSL